MVAKSECLKAAKVMNAADVDVVGNVCWRKKFSPYGLDENEADAHVEFVGIKRR